MCAFLVLSHLIITSVHYVMARYKSLEEHFTPFVSDLESF
jgi:hypothetical protein